LCHFIVVCLVVGVPFFGNYYLVMMHSIMVPFMMAHWYFNDNTCVLSLMELQLRKNLGEVEIEQKDCFTCQLINPIYDFKANYSDWTVTIYTITTFLWMVSIYRLYCGYKIGDLRSFQDLLLK
jgi:hypothetical protein